MERTGEGKAWKCFSINHSKLHWEGWRWEGASDIGYSAQVYSEVASELGRCAEFEPHGPCWDDDRTLPTAVPGVRSSVKHISRIGRSDHRAFSLLRGNRPAV